MLKDVRDGEEGDREGLTKKEGKRAYLWVMDNMTMQNHEKKLGFDSTPGPFCVELFFICMDFLWVQ